MTMEDLDKLRDNLANQLPSTVAGIVIIVDPATPSWSMRHTNLGPGETADILRDGRGEILKAMLKCQQEGHQDTDPGLLGKETT